MARKKRHSVAEIGAKLRQAGALTREGKTVNEIARTLGISVMTLHRWKKARPQLAGAAPTRGRMIASGPKPAPLDSIAELQAENARLRRLLTDFLLEKLSLEEGLDPRARRKS